MARRIVSRYKGLLGERKLFNHGVQFIANHYLIGSINNMSQGRSPVRGILQPGTLGSPLELGIQNKWISSFRTPCPLNSAGESTRLMSRASLPERRQGRVKFSALKKPVTLTNILKDRSTAGKKQRIGCYSKSQGRLINQRPFAGLAPSHVADCSPGLFWT